MASRPLWRSSPGLVRRGGVLGEQLSELGEALQVEQPEVGVLELTDGFDVGGFHGAPDTALDRACRVSGPLSTGASVPTALGSTGVDGAGPSEREVLGRLGQDGAQRRLDLVELVVTARQDGRQLDDRVDPVVGPAHEPLFEEPRRDQAADQARRVPRG